jgi:hypothetical protein
MYGLRLIVEASPYQLRLRSLPADCPILLLSNRQYLFSGYLWSKGSKEFPAIKGIYFERITPQRNLVCQVPAAPVITKKLSGLIKKSRNALVAFF